MNCTHTFFRGLRTNALRGTGLRAVPFGGSVGTHARPLRRNLSMTTFRPENLRPRDFSECLPLHFAKFYCAPIPQNAEAVLGKQHVGASMAWVPKKPPETCRGFLYYYAPTSTALAGSMRFRLTPDYDPASDVSPTAAFAAGSDLPIPNGGGLPWALPAWCLARHSTVRDIMSADGRVLPGPKITRTSTLNEYSLALYALGQPFLFEFHMPSVRAWLLTPGGSAVCARIEPGFTDIANKRFRMPYEGMGVMTLERLEDGSFATRLQKILTLSQVYINTNVLPPVEGLTHPLRVAPVLFKEATQPTHRKYKGALQAVVSAVSRLPQLETTLPTLPTLQKF
ncbi:hypothetical protein DFH09DRAFT_349050 [Mycena vulgaris]|nr:hypothetical protein DFH09DRAFT_349050 [Mycena vulgaris]